MTGRSICKAAVALTLCLALAGCASTPQTGELLARPPGDLPVAATVDNVPFYPQEAYQCGPAALATVLSHSGVSLEGPGELVPEVYIPARQGSLQPEMLATARRFGRVSYPLVGELEAVLREVTAGHPVVVFQNLGLNWLPQWHYAVLVGYDLAGEEVLLRSGTTENHDTSLKLFERTWQRGGHWAFVALEPGELPAGAEPGRYFEAVAAFEQVNPPEAVARAWRSGLRRWPQSRLMAMGLSNHLYAEERFRDAADVLQELLEYHPDDADAHNNLAHALLALGETEAAREHARRAVALGGEREQQYRETLSRIEH